MKASSAVIIRGLLGLALGPATCAEAPTFHRDIAPLLYQHCAPCHRAGGQGPFPLISFDDARKRAGDIVEVTSRHAMPPWLPDQPGVFEGERRLTDAEILLLKNWRATDAAEGDVAHALTPPVFASDWELGPPDLVVKMPAPYLLPAEGRDVYRHFVIPLDLPARRHVRAWELRPNSRAAHHAFLRVDRSGEGRRLDALDAGPGFPGMDTPRQILAPNGHFAGWQPGARAKQNRPGLAWTLEPGTDLVVQMHLQPTGRPEPVQVEIGFYFTDIAPTNQPLKIGLVNYDLNIPAGATNVVATDELVIPADTDLLGVLPHTHYLGRRIEAEATLPDGTRRELLRIPEWDFNWQGDYAYREPVFLPAGSRVTMRITFDNSAANPRNPFHPPRDVRFGLSTTDEMAEVWLQLLPRTPAAARALADTVVKRTARDVVAYMRERLRMDPDDGVAHLRLGGGLLAQGQFDAARREFQRAAELMPASDDAPYQLGLVNRAQGRPADAARAFTRALELNPRNARAHGNLGLMHLQAGRMDVAARHLEAAIAADPNDVIALLTLGEIQAEQGKLDEGLRLVTRAVELAPEDEEAAKVLKALRRRAEAAGR